jgi:hypothetical protein
VSMRTPRLAAALAALAGAATIAACAEQPAAQAVATQDFSVAARDGRCVLTARSQEWVLQPKPPCFFVHDEKGRIQTHETRDAASTRLILIGGTPANPDPDPVPRDAGPCGTEVQAVAVRADTVRLLTRISRGSRICSRQGGVDAKFFELFDR